MPIRTSIGLVAGSLLAVALPLLAAERLAVKTGLWENTITLQLSGITIPADQLSRMTPEQRAQAEAVMKQLGVGAPSTITEQSCLTEKDLDGKAFAKGLEEAGDNCDYKQVTGTSKKQEWTFQCRTDSGDATGRMVIDVVNDSTVRGTMTARMPQGSLDMKFDAAWKGNDCGDVKPGE